jgi:hypothetical protein
MTTIEKQTLTFYDWGNITDEVERRTGRDTRNWANKSWSADTPDRPYQDFWHMVLDVYEIHNGCFIDSFDVNDIWEYYMDKPNHEWVKEVVDAYNEVFGELEANGFDDGQYTIKIWW